MEVRKYMEIAQQAVEQYGIKRGAQLQAFMKGISYAEKQHEWRSVEDELPETSSDLLLTFDAADNYHVSWLDCDGKWQNFNSTCGEAVVEITHWMPLPQEPEGHKF